MNLYASPAITAVGVLGNGLSLAVIVSQQRSHASSFSVYLAALSVADAGSLVTWAYRWKLLVWKPRRMTHSECRVDIGLKYAFRMAGYFFILVLTVDRLLGARCDRRLHGFINGTMTLFRTKVIVSHSTVFGIL